MVLSLDAWLCRRHGVFEYSDSRTCIFRIARARAELDVTLADGTSIHPGAPVLNLHLWNEQVPSMDKDGASIRWARQTSRAMDHSLCELAGFLARSQELADIVAIRADMRLATKERRKKLALLVEHFGFEQVVGGHANRLHSFGENILMLLLVWVVNPSALHSDVLRRGHMLFYYSRRALERRYRVNVEPQVMEAHRERHMEDAA